MGAGTEGLAVTLPFLYGGFGVVRVSIPTNSYVWHLG